MMADKQNDAEAFLEALENALEVLGPDETRDVVAEIRGLIAEASLDVRGDENAALAGFGKPEVLAAGILQERGVLPEQSRVPEASLGLQAIGMGIDVALSLAAVAILYSFASRGLYAASYWGYGSPFLTTLTWTAGAVLLGALAWWWAKRLRQTGYTSPGMEAAGIRRVRIGETVRVVRSRDIPGLAGAHRIAPKIMTAIALLVLAAFVLGVAYSRDAQMEAEIRRVVEETGISAGLVSGVYRDVTLGRGMSSLLPSSGPNAEADMRALIERYAAGEFDSYHIFITTLPEGPGAKMDFSDPLSDTVINVLVIESPSGDGPDAIYEYAVRRTGEPTPGGARGGYFIESVASGQN
jgi:hypothetical protein